jgi:hypothetical protein
MTKQTVNIISNTFSDFSDLSSGNSIPGSRNST